jgi:uncharacterized membrane protein
VAGKRRERVADAVVRAEVHTGLQFCVYLGKASQETPRELAERLFVDTHPAVLLAVVPSEHRVEILTAPEARERVPDEACADAIDLMRPALKRKRYEEALVLAVDHLASVAGPGEAVGESLPDIVDES